MTCPLTPCNASPRSPAAAGLPVAARVRRACRQGLAAAIGAVALAAASAQARELRVSGVADASLRISYLVTFIALDCSRFNPLAGFSTQKTRQVSHEVDNTTGRYQLRLPLTPGAQPLDGCHWRALEIASAAIRRSVPAGASADLQRSLISVDKPDGVATQRIELVCRSAPTAQGGKSPHQLSCWPQDATPSLRKTVAPGQQALQVDFVLTAE